MVSIDTAPIKRRSAEMGPAAIAKRSSIYCFGWGRKCDGASPGDRGAWETRNETWHGLRSIEAIERRRAMTTEARELRRLMRALREEQRRVLELVE